jgi:transcription-repair coupling factor (superfamily II helicase)
MFNLRVKRLDRGDNTLVFSFTETTPLEPAQLLGTINSSKGQMRLTPDSRLVVNIEADQPLSIINEAKKILHTLQQDATRI